jgi:hypothetical protein
MRLACGTIAANLALAAFLSLGAGCVSTDKELAREESRRESEWKALVSPARPAAHRELSWPEALALVRGHNTKVRSADVDVVRAAEALDQVRKSLIPTASFEAGYNRFFSSSGSPSYEPFTFAATLLFDVPGIVNYRIRYEAAVLTLAHARLLRETVWREQVIALYRAALEGDELSQRALRLERAERAIAALAEGAPRAAARERGALAGEHREIGRERAEWLLRLGGILGAPGEDIAIARASLPDLPYAEPGRRPSVEAMARLPLKLAALDLLAIRARKLGITLQEWPEVDVNVTSPTVFETGPSQRNVWSPRQVFAGVNSYWTLDTQGHRASERRLMDGELTYRREVLEQEEKATAAKLTLALDGLRRTDRDVALVDEALARPGGAARRDLLGAREELQRERRDWTLTIWFFDDAQWTDDST